MLIDRFYVDPASCFLLTHFKIQYVHIKGCYSVHVYWNS
jgi:hypothetical protein